MFRISRNPRSSSFGMGQPNLRPVARIGGMAGVRAGEYYPASSVADVKKAVQKSLERSKK